MRKTYDYNMIIIICNINIQKKTQNTSIVHTQKREHRAAIHSAARATLVKKYRRQQSRNSHFLQRLEKGHDKSRKKEHLSLKALSAKITKSTGL